MIHRRAIWPETTVREQAYIAADLETERKRGIDEHLKNSPWLLGDNYGD